MLNLNNKKELFIFLIVILILMVAAVIFDNIVNKKKNSNYKIDTTSTSITTTSVSTTVSTSTDDDEAFSEMTESDIRTSKKLNIYVFWGKGCPHCKEFSESLKNLPAEYKSYYDLYTFEIWYNNNNAELMEKFADHFNETVSGVPYIIIGSTTFSGYSSSMDEEIKNAIKKEYNNKVHYDAYKEIKG